MNVITKTVPVVIIDTPATGERVFVNAQVLGIKDGNLWVSETVTEQAIDLDETARTASLTPSVINLHPFPVADVTFLAHEEMPADLLTQVAGQPFDREFTDFALMVENN